MASSDDNDFSNCETYTGGVQKGKSARVVWELTDCNKKELFDALKLNTSCKVEFPPDEASGRRISLRFYFKEKRQPVSNYLHDYLSLCCDVLEETDYSSVLPFTVKVDNLTAERTVASNMLPETTVSLNSRSDRRCKVISENFLLTCRWNSDGYGAIASLYSNDITSVSIIYGITVTLLKVTGWTPQSELEVARVAFSNSFKTMYASDENFSDLKLESKDKIVIDAHKFVLGARSPVLRRLLLQETKTESFTGTLQIPDVDGKPLMVLLYWMYTGELDDRIGYVVEDVMKAAKQYEVTDLLQVLDKKLITICNFQNMLDLFAAARKFKMLTAMTDISSFIKDNITNTLPLV